MMIMTTTLRKVIEGIAVADAIGVSKQYISKCLKKYPKLTGCRLTDTENVDIQQDINKTASTL